VETGKRTILVVDDDKTFRGRLGKAFERRDFNVLLAEHVISAEELIEANGLPQYAVVDLRMPGANGMELVESLCASAPKPNVVVLTAYGSIANAMEAVKLGAVDYLTKPADADQILAALDGGKQDSEAHKDAAPITLEQVEWEHINRTLLENDGNISATARALGIHRRSLQRKLSKWSPWQPNKVD